MKKRVAGRIRLAVLAIAGIIFGVMPLYAAEPETTPSAVPLEERPIITREETIELQDGDRRKLDMDADILDVAVTRPEVIDAFPSRTRELALRANSAGVGKVVVQLDDGATVAYKVRVYVADPEQFANQLRDALGHIQGIQIEVIRGRVLVDGRVLYLKDMDEIERAIGDNPSIINLTSLSSRNARIVAREIERELRESGIYGARVEVRNNRVTLVGSLGSEVLVKKAEQIAGGYTPKFDSRLKIVSEPATESRD
jgi:Flp pilus assembly secretin CpaC